MITLDPSLFFKLCFFHSPFHFGLIAGVHIVHCVTQLMISYFIR